MDTSPMPTETTRPVPPDVAVIKRARAGARVPVSKAAEAASVSEVRWNQLEADRETRGGVVRRPHAKAETIARMAYGVNRAAGTVVISPERLETEGHNPEAAVLLAEMLDQDAARTPPPPGRDRQLPTLDALDDPGIEPYRRVVDMERDSGLPPRSDQEARIWDTTRLSEDEKRRFVAELRWVTDGAARIPRQASG